MCCAPPAGPRLSQCMCTAATCGWRAGDVAPGVHLSGQPLAPVARQCVAQHGRVPAPGGCARHQGHLVHRALLPPAMQCPSWSDLQTRQQDWQRARALRLCPTVPAHRAGEDAEGEAGEHAEAPGHGRPGSALLTKSSSQHMSPADRCGSPAACRPQDAAAAPPYTHACMGRSQTGPPQQQRLAGRRGRSAQVGARGGHAAPHHGERAAVRVQQAPRADAHGRPGQEGAPAALPGAAAARAGGLQTGLAAC